MKKNYRRFTSESVSSGHPDKLADQISDALLDDLLSQDRESKVACETFITDGLVVVGGEVTSEGYTDIKQIARKVIKGAGYTPETCFDPDNFGFVNCIHEQSPDIRRGVVREDPRTQGAGDQGIMFGYATNETTRLMPATLTLANEILVELEYQKKQGIITGYGPDAKSQVTLNIDGDGTPVSIDTILVSTQHLETKEESEIENDIRNVVNRVRDRQADLSKLFNDEYRLLINPTGKFVIGGPKGDTGLTGRKIIVDTYGGYGAHGGGAFSGKDPSKVDRSAAYVARYLAKNVVASEICNQCLVQISYAIGVSQPVSVYIRTDAGDKVDEYVKARIINEIDLSPYGIIKRLKLKNPIYFPTSCYGHFGKIPYTDGNLEFFNWEKTDISWIFT